MVVQCVDNKMTSNSDIDFGSYDDCTNYGDENEYYNASDWSDFFDKFKKLWYATKMSKVYIVTKIEPFCSLVNFKQKINTDDGDVITQNNVLDSVYKCILTTSRWDEDPDEYTYTLRQVYFLIHNDKLYVHDFERMLNVGGDPWGYGNSIGMEPYTFRTYIIPDVRTLKGFVHIDNDMKYLPENKITGEIYL